MLAFDLNNNRRHVHFIGIGGVSMSGLAEILNQHGFAVSGSDMKESKITRHLQEQGIKVYIGHSKDHVHGADTVIYTDAISMDNEELQEAIRLKLDLIDRARFLGQLMLDYKRSIAVSGTHGKTSTTSMITNIIKDLDENPTILLGGNLDAIHGNVRLGDHRLFLTEACEYKANIIKYFPTTAIILNMDEDHLDYFDNMDHIYRTFAQYVANVPAEGHVLLNIDDPQVKKLEGETKAHIESFAINQEADYRAEDLSFDDFGYPSFDLYYKGEKIDRVQLQVLGRHNVYNSLAAIAAVHINGISFDKAIAGIEDYKGVHRRLETKGKVRGILVIDDYGHHPTEIKSTLHALRMANRGKIFCVFQPHTFTRTKLLLDGFAKSFHEADAVVITDIYAAREKDYGDIHSKTLVEAINKEENIAQYISSFDDVVDYYKAHLKPGDTLVTMGAGDVYLIGEKFLREVREEEKES